MRSIEMSELSAVAEKPTGDKQFEVIVTYNGVEEKIRVNENQAIQAVLEHALRAFGIQGNPHNLVLATESNPNVELPLDKKVKDVGIQPGTKLVLRPRRAGAG
jgi:hypothetical protein